MKQISDAGKNNSKAIMPDERNFGLGFIKKTTTQLAGEEEEETDNIGDGSRKKKRFWLF